LIEALGAIGGGLAESIPFPVEKVFNKYDSRGQTCREVMQDNPGLALWLAYQFKDYERIPAQKLAVCAMRYLHTLVEVAI